MSNDKVQSIMALVEDYGNALSGRDDLYQYDPRDELEEAKRRVIAVRSAIESAIREAIAAPGVAQGWQAIESAPENEMVLVGWLDPEDDEHPERHDFDLKEDDCWQRHHDDLEHFMMVAPGGSRGPSQTAPYTHWMRIGKIPAAPPTAEQPDHIPEAGQKVSPTPVSIKGENQ